MSDRPKGRMPRERNKDLHSEALWQVYQLKAKTGVNDQSKQQQRNVTNALVVAVVTLLGLVSLLIWAAWQ